MDPSPDTLSPDDALKDAPADAPRAGPRRPPLPHWRSGKGRCRWCGEAVLKPDGTANLRRLWHDDCVRAYKLATSSGEIRRAVWRRDRGRCAACRRQFWRRLVVERPPLLLPRDAAGGTRCPVAFADGAYSPVSFRKANWQADHAVPLWSVDRALPWAEAVGYWSLENLQTLCDPCHRDKRVREAAERARLRRQAGG